MSPFSSLGQVPQLICISHDAPQWISKRCNMEDAIWPWRLAHRGELGCPTMPPIWHHSNISDSKFLSENLLVLIFCQKSTFLSRSKSIYQSPLHTFSTSNCIGSFGDHFVSCWCFYLWESLHLMELAYVQALLYLTPLLNSPVGFFSACLFLASFS